MQLCTAFWGTFPAWWSKDIKENFRHLTHFVVCGALLLSIHNITGTFCTHNFKNHQDGQSLSISTGCYASAWWVKMVIQCIIIWLGLEIIWLGLFPARRQILWRRSWGLSSELSGLKPNSRGPDGQGVAIKEAEGLLCFKVCKSVHFKCGSDRIFLVRKALAKQGDDALGRARLSIH